MWVDEQLSLIKALDAFRRADDMVEMGKALQFVGRNSRMLDEMDSLLLSFMEARKVTFATLPEEQQEVLQGKQVGQAIDQLRLDRIREVIED
jgi:hypothetical protein